MRKPPSQAPVFLAFILGVFSITSLCLATKLDTNAIARQLNRCGAESDCPGGQVCITESGRCLDEDCDGVCARQIICSCQEPCQDGQTCVETTGAAISFITCFPDSAIDELSSIAEPIECSNTNTPNDVEDSNDSSEICVAVDMLQSFRPHELVFEEHALAHVLCDPTGSCATKGHLVVYRGSPMMMQSYCKIVGCRRAVMQVNSPRFRRGLKIMSKSSDMHFTAFAARYGTYAEEVVLSAAARIGL